MISGGWEIKVAVDAMPQKLATAFSEIFDNFVGAEYSPIAYLGSQVVKGLNHAVLAEQVLINGRDTYNIVLIVINEFNEKFSIVNIERVLEGGTGLGGMKIDVKTQIPAEAQAAFDGVFETFLGSSVKPFALLGTQVVKGTNYYFVAETTMITRPVGAGVGMKFGSNKEISIITVNSMTNHAEFNTVLSGSGAVDVSLGTPLGEWP